VDPLVRLSPLEATIDTPVGERDGAPPLPEVDPRHRPLEALERAVVPALRHPPCLVDFSGGRDSSTVLAVAARVARREGLPLPIPSTDVFPGRPETEESPWQELVIRHLDLPDWRRRIFKDEIDLIGPVARRVMSRHGLISPCTAYAKLPSLEDAAGGTVVTGLDGDGLFGDWTFTRAWSVLTGRARPAPRDLLRIARLAAPIAGRRLLLQRRLSLDVSWLRPAAAAELEGFLVRELAGEPRRWDLRVDWWARSRVLAALRDGLGVLARDVGTRLVHPFLDRIFLAAMSRAGARSGLGDRTRVMRALFGDLLPSQVLSRGDKANFTFVYFTDESRAFAEQWNGDGVRRDLVDPERLRGIWRAAPPASPDMRSGLLLQAAWLAGSGADVQRHFNCDLE
jgi:asparagine synthase (glutamine-hydrolysing)